MILSLILYAILTKADNHYYECFDHKTCATVYEGKKLYCYYGECTDTCPPGYEKINFGNSRHFNCTCNKALGVERDGYFNNTYFRYLNEKCKCNKTFPPFCRVNVYAEGIGYTDGLIPRGAPPNCKVNTEHIPDVLTEFAFFLVVITMSIFAFVNCRSASGVTYDLHRYYGIYTLGSLTVLVFVSTVTPFSVGFTRTMGFGIMAHNSSEWNILLRLHFGKTAFVRNSTNVCVIIYYIVMLLLTSFLPLELLLYVAMIQGGFVDWILVYFVFVAGKSMKKECDTEHVFKKCCETLYSRFVFWYGFGACFQLLAVEILFVGFQLNNAKLIGAGGFFLLPAFFCFTIWVYSQEGYMLICGPSLFMNYDKNYKKTKTLLVPFRHNTQFVDVLWHSFMGGYKSSKKTDMEMQSYDANENQTNDDEIVANYLEQDEQLTKFHVEDCESFMFGIHEHVSKCHCAKHCRCCSWIPLYWVAAFVTVIINVLVIMILPMILPTKGKCNTGFDYGSW